MAEFTYTGGRHNDFAVFSEGKPCGDDPPLGETRFMVFEAVADEDSVSDFAAKSARSRAMGAVLTWVEDGDYTYQALDDIIYGLADIDEDGEVTEDEQDAYDEIYLSVGDALASLGASTANIQAFMDDEDDEAGAKIGNKIAGEMEEAEQSDDDVISAFALESTPKDAEVKRMVLEGVKKVIRDGAVVLVKKRVKKRRLSAAQRAGLKKARRKANSSAARKSRMKSMKIRKQRGL